MAREICWFNFDTKKKTAVINDIPIPLVELKATNGKVQCGIEKKYCIDPNIDSINKRWQPLHLELVKHCAFANAKIGIHQLYMYLLHTDRIKPKHFKGLGFYAVQIDPIVSLFVSHNACHNTGQGIKKTEAYTKFLIGREEAVEGEVDEGTLKVTTLHQLKAKEERLSRVYELPDQERLAGMSLMELQLERTDAEEKDAKRKIIEKLNRAVASRMKDTHHKKSDMDIMKEAIKLEKEESKHEKSTSKGRRIWKDKHGAEYVE